MDSSLPLQHLKGVGPKLAAIFSKKGISTLEDALYFLPRGHEDRRSPTPISQIRPGQNCLVQARVEKSQWLGGRGRRQFEVDLVDDSEGHLTLHWFHTYPSLSEEFKIGREVTVYGEVKFFRGRLQMAHPDFAPKDSQEFKAVVPIYSLPEGLSQKLVRKVVQLAAKETTVEDCLPVDIRQRNGLVDLGEALKLYHLPETLPSPDQLHKARERLVFEEFFLFQLGLLLNRKQTGTAPVLSGGLGDFEQRFPFALTSDQHHAIQQIEIDLKKSRPMTRLLQGDVGSGKTVVALSAIFIAARSGFQSAFMVPTEVLAQQHFEVAKKVFNDHKCVLLVQGADNEIREQVTSGEAKVVIGTHALFQEAVEFHKLGLVIVDEQHRFGVRQRLGLVKKAKGQTPHLLMMTATPIPRTLSLTLFGDLDVSIVREKPKERKSIKTRILFESQRAQLAQIIRKRVFEKQQAYVIYPLVEDSEKIDLRSATEMFERIKRAFSDFQVGLVHGRMESREKEQVLEAFRRNQIQILVATTVVEVGIDVPNATLMVIEHAERLGLSQLHQLRGRVGRGTLESECILVSRFRTNRLAILAKSDDGFVIAEEDLKLRGPGEFLGTRQSGLAGFRVGNLVEDGALLNLAHEEATRLINRDSQLELAENTKLKVLVNTAWKEKISQMAKG